MRTRIFAPLLLLAALAPAAEAVAPDTTALTLQPESRIWVEGTSTVRSFQCTAKQVDAAVDAVSTGAASAVAAGDKAIRAVSIRIPARALDCNNGTMNGHMYKALKADQHATITFRLGGYELVPGAEATTVKMNGTLDLGGVEKPIQLEAKARSEGDALRVTGTEAVSLSDHGLRAPSLMMGTMKVGDQVNVKFDLVLKP